MSEPEWRGFLDKFDVAHEGPGAPPTDLLIQAGARYLGPKGFEIVTAAGADAIGEINRLRSERTEMSPLLIGAPSALIDLWEAMEDGAELHGANPEEILRRADAVDLDAWIASARAERETVAAESESVYPERGDWPDIDGRDAEPLLSQELYPSVRQLVEWEALDSEEELPTPEYRPLPEVAILLAPTPDPCEIPAHLGFGGWNDCPTPEIHVALARRWRDQFGALWIAASHDIVEFQVTRPPSTREAALALADLHHLYCCDAVDQGLETLEALAAERLNAPFWGFWWD